MDFKVTDETLFLSLGPEADRETLSTEGVQQALQDSELNRCRVDEDLLRQAISRLASTDETLIAIGESLPATLQLSVSADDMQVEAIVTSPSGGAPLTINKVLRQLREHGVTSGVRRNAIEKLIRHSEQAEPGSEIKALIARGRPAIAGEDTRFEPLVQDARERVLQPQKRDGDRVDMRDLGEIVSVQPGTPILRRVACSAGSVGFTVRGAALEPTPGNDRPLQADVGTEICSDDPDVLLATRHGLPCIVDNTAHVDDVLTMRKVDATTGHVDYDGSVIVQGNVGPGMRVRADGDITINGYVDSAHIEALGNITVTKGVIGQQTDVDMEHDEHYIPDHSTHVKAAGSIWVSYSQYATLEADHGIIVDKQLTHCHVISRGTVSIGGEGKDARGKLIGGIVETSTHVYAGQIGAPAGAKTRIHLSVAAPDNEHIKTREYLYEQLRVEMRQIKKMTRVRERALEEMPPAKQQKFLTTLDQKMAEHRRNVSVLKIQCNELQALAPENQSIHVFANRVLYSGVIFRFGAEVARIIENRGPTDVVLKNGSFSYQHVG
ncbi:DUF342 domain-containing protein [Aliidiomarina sp. Khilg15.8]